MDFLKNDIFNIYKIKLIVDICGGMLCYFPTMEIWMDVMNMIDAQTSIVRPSVKNKIK